MGIGFLFTKSRRTQSFVSLVRIGWTRFFPSQSNLRMADHGSDFFIYIINVISSETIGGLKVRLWVGELIPRSKKIQSLLG